MSALQHEDENRVTTEAVSDAIPLLDGLDTMSIMGIMNDLDAEVPSRIRDALDRVAVAVDLAVASFKAGGRLIYVGAGTSGRIAVADAAETGPTFGIDNVEAIMAGGIQAIVCPSEGCEDNRQAGAQAVSSRGVHAADTVVGVTANGRTPFVRSALEQASGLGASTVLITSNAVDDFEGNCLIAVDTGPEIVRGSTRLKAGTAAKLVLNMISTVSMIKVGRVVSNEMVYMVPSNAKLACRAATMLSQLLQIEVTVAGKLLHEAGNLPAAAILMHRRGLSRNEAIAAIEEDPLVVRQALQR
ncbi:MAG: N-acetylmuramic acid 6-phosphate etherase [bacterium]|nr:N-acetylmuramic acid 6-phosphate etherase [bacterium]